MAERGEATEAGLRLRALEWPDVRLRWLWDARKDMDDHWLQSFAILAAEANELMSRIHRRMPVILHSRDYDRWLDREETERLPLELLRRYESEAMEVDEANPKVNNGRSNGPEMMRAAGKLLRMRAAARA